MAALVCVIGAHQGLDALRRHRDPIILSYGQVGESDQLSVIVSTDDREMTWSSGRSGRRQCRRAGFRRRLRPCVASWVVPSSKPQAVAGSGGEHHWHQVLPVLGTFGSLVTFLSSSGAGSASGRTPVASTFHTYWRSASSTNMTARAGLTRARSSTPLTAP